MKKLVFITCLLFVILGTTAQTIHWITFVDTTDRRVGKLDVNGHEVLYNNFINDVNAALAEKGYESDIQDFVGENVSPANCRSAVELLRVSPEDIIVFYYIGHGGRPNTGSEYIEQHPYPQLYLAQEDGKKCIPLEWINNTLKAKGARLTVTIGMACNSLDNTMVVKTGPTFSANYGTARINDNKLSRIQELFLGVKGNVIATSALPTQSSIGAETIFGPMDYYSAAICDIFKNKLNSWTEKMTWESFLNTVGDLVEASSDKEQTPFFEAHLADTQIPSVPVGTTPTPTPPELPTKAKTTTTQTDWNELTNKLTELANSSIEEGVRIKMEQQMNRLFANRAIIKILCQDGSAVYDKELADVFLGRLATSRLLLKVQVVDGNQDSNNKITLLKVKETYKTRR